MEIRELETAVARLVLNRAVPTGLVLAGAGGPGGVGLTREFADAVRSLTARERAATAVSESSILQTKSEAWL